MVNDHVAHANIANTAIDPKTVLVENAANTVSGPTSQPPSESNIYARASNSPPMAVLPLNSSAKLDQEPNPFEQSFSSASKTSPGSEKSKQPKSTTNATTTAATSTTTTTTTTTTAAAMASTNNGSADSSQNLTSTTTAHPTSNEPLKLPPVAAMTSPAATSVMSSVPKDVASQYAWDSLRTGPLSPSMLQRPTNPDDYAYSNINPSSSLLSYQDVPSNSYQAKSDSYYQQQERPQPVTQYQDKQKPPQKATKKSTPNKKNPNNSLSPTTTSPTATNRRRKIKSEDDDGDDDEGNDYLNNDGEGSSNKKPRTDDEDEKRKNFLERNRLAALKCRQRKKQWLNNLQAKVEFLTNDNEQLQIQTNALREEIMNLKTLLLAHKDCPISQANGFPSNLSSKSQPQQTLIHGSGGVPNSGAPSVTTTTTTPVSMASMYTQQQQQQQQPYNHSHLPHPHQHPHQHQHQHPHPHPHQHRMSTSSTGSQSSSGLNMMMVSQHQGTAPPPPSSIQNSSSVIQF
ncbi:hypothetical protein BCR42DRAFT_424407 [Absidia repens]|uniref:BZIP domain-containing protein n=1 Tax=Absidia repens TaxID=90262 RepID=A0A1X2I5R6_9FUNG|nr:hypothetical protein BCR42DRAFT_424407 [Absidia repens]